MNITVKNIEKLLFIGICRFSQHTVEDLVGDIFGNIFYIYPNYFY
ncbi:hypothetical protein KIS1582_0699 [Cytobacillus firmus]|uniref:Uncharacterized protein n=1 Tax=Cytobacillus firmus TaxID=1399 RepID=A0A800NEN7_CYTFI|nr:hypothetical protein KIS1582_0699 [Cytobacillus firmus]